MSFPEFFNVNFVCLIDGTAESIHKETQLKYWSIRDWYRLYRLFQIFCSKYGVCRLEITPSYHEAY